MSQTKAHPASESSKKRGDALTPKDDVAMLEADLHTLEGATADPIPPASHGSSHAHSPAAHLHEGGKPNTKPAGNLRQGSHPTALREPPTVVQRAGKQHK